jgi:putative endonuclease
LAKSIRGAIGCAMEEEKLFQRGYVYLMTNERGNVLYIGSTEDLKTRLRQHKKRQIAGFTRKYNVCKLVYFEEHPNIECAEKREKELKGKTRAKKNAVVESANPEWADLSAKIIQPFC